MGLFTGLSKLFMKSTGSDGMVWTKVGDNEACWMPPQGGGGGSYTLPPATNTTLGGVIIKNANTRVDENGVLSIPGYSLFWKPNNGEYITAQELMACIRVNLTYFAAAGPHMTLNSRYESATVTLQKAVETPFTKNLTDLLSLFDSYAIIQPQMMMPAISVITRKCDMTFYFGGTTGYDCTSINFNYHDDEANEYGTGSISIDYSITDDWILRAQAYVLALRSNFITS